MLWGKTAVDELRLRVAAALAGVSCLTLVTNVADLYFDYVMRGWAAHPLGVSSVECRVIRVGWSKQCHVGTVVRW